MLESTTIADIRWEVREAMENRARLFTELGYEFADGEWRDKRVGLLISNQEVREIYRIGNDERRPPKSPKWPWPACPF